MLRIQNFIGGSFTNPVGNQWLDLINPATNEVFGNIPASQEDDVLLAVEAATKSQFAWQNCSSNDRFLILNRIADGIEEHLEELALAETNDTGKPLQASRTIDIPRAAANFRFFATAAMHFASESHTAPDSINYTLRQPIGIVGCISPWNLPLYLFTWKIAPALATGNCVIAKPSEMSPTTAYLLGRIVKEAGLPDGVLNILHGLGPQVGMAMVAHPKIKAISFTGGTKTGQTISSVAAPMFKKLSLELGGKNPCIVFNDCDYDKTLSEVSRLAFSNQGQICLCGSRILIQKDIYEKFKTDLIQKVSSIRIGDPLDSKTQMGSLISAQHLDKVTNYIHLAQSEGGTLLFGGNKIHPEGRCQNGAFLEPTVFEHLGPNCRTNQEEIFGPVITLQSFSDETEALELANASEYGLAASIWTRDLNRAHRLSQNLQTGIVWVNCWLLRDLRTPFGGIKNSGVGREGGWEAMRFFTEAKNVCIKFK